MASTQREKRKHVVIAGGGTGGHLFPGVALAEELRRLDEEVEVTFVGTEKGIEARLIPKLGYRLECMEVTALKGGGVAGLLKGAMKLPGSGLAARKMVKRLDPSLVVAVGGYASGPMTMTASMMGVPTVLMEQNSVPGMTNRWLGKVVDEAFLTYACSADEFPAGKVNVVGNPLRRSLVERARAFSYRTPQGSGEKVSILVLGGSGGSLALNRDVPGALCALPEALQRNLSVTHQVGKQSGELAREAYQAFLGEAEVVDFIDDMPAVYERTHLMICRAGATTIAEVLGYGIPAIYIPFSGAADDHQTINAMEVVEGGGGMMVREPEVSEGRLTRLVEGVMNNPESLQGLAKGARAMGRLDAGEQIAARCLARMRGEE